MIRRPPGPTLLPYTTRFRSEQAMEVVGGGGLDFGQTNAAHRRERLGGVDHVRRLAALAAERHGREVRAVGLHQQPVLDRKSTRLNSSHANISYAVFCLNKKT